MSDSSTEEPAGPRLSVIVASSNSGALLARCVASLAPQAQRSDVEVLVARDVGRFDDVDRAGISRASPGVKWVDAPVGSTVPQLRGLGIREARGVWVAMLEDDCIVDSGWCHAALTMPGAEAAVGGAVEPGPYPAALDWAVYFCEYGRFMLPVPAMPSAPLTGNNVVYSMRALSALSREARAEFHDAFVHAAWAEAGISTRVTGALVVRNVNAWSLKHVTSVPFHHGRAYAARRFGGRNAAARAVIALLAAVLPVVKTGRVVAEVWSRRRWVRQLIQALPWIVVFNVSWSAGEIVGCVSGAGDSPSRWR